MILALFVLFLLCCSTASAMDEAELRQKISEGGHGQVVTLGAERIELTSPLVISNRKHFKLIGRGEEATVFTYTGDPALSAIILENGLRCELHGFGVRGQCAAGISIRTSEVPGPHISSENLCNHIGVSQGPKVGFYIDSTLRDSNNEFHRFKSCSARRCELAGFRINGSQCHRIQFDNCTASYCGKGLWGEHGNYWTWRDGQATQNKTDFDLGSFWIRVEIDGHRSEGSERFFTTSSHWSMMPIDIRGVTWDGKPPAGLPIIKIQGNGPISLESSIFTSNNGNPARVEIFDHDPGSFYQSGLVFITNRAPAGDYAQLPIAVPSWFAIDGMPGLIESRSGQPWARTRYRLSGVDLTDAITVSLPVNEFQQGDTIPMEWPLRHSGYEQQRSFSIFMRVSMSNGSSGSSTFCSAAGLEVGMKRILPNYHLQVRPGLAYNAIDGFEHSAEYPVVVVYSRDPNYLLHGQPKAGSVMAGMLGSLKSYHTPEPITRHPVITFGGRGFDGSIRDVRMWDRALLVEEARALLSQ